MPGNVIDEPGVVVFERVVGPCSSWPVGVSCWYQAGRAESCILDWRFNQAISTKLCISFIVGIRQSRWPVNPHNPLPTPAQSAFEVQKVVAGSSSHLLFNWYKNNVKSIPSGSSHLPISYSVQVSTKSLWWILTISFFSSTLNRYCFRCRYRHHCLRNSRPDPSLICQKHRDFRIQHLGKFD